MRLRTLAAVLAAFPLALAGCAGTARTGGSADVETASAPTIDEICGGRHEMTCLELYYALSAEAFGTGGKGLQELYEGNERGTEDWVQSNLEDLRAGTFRSHHGIAGLSDPAEYVRLKAEYWRELNESFRNDMSRLLETTSYLKLADEARQHFKNSICYYEHEPNNYFYRVLVRNKKVAPGHPDAGAPLVDCSDYAGPWLQPFEVRGLPEQHDLGFKAWLREREGGAK